MVTRKKPTLLAQDNPARSGEARARGRVRLFTQFEAALDTEKDTPAEADVRASRTVEMLAKEYLKDEYSRVTGCQLQSLSLAGGRARRATRSAAAR